MTLYNVFDLTSLNSGMDLIKVLYNNWTKFFLQINVHYRLFQTENTSLHLRQRAVSSMDLVLHHKGSSVAKLEDCRGVVVIERLRHASPLKVKFEVNKSTKGCLIWIQYVANRLLLVSTPPPRLVAEPFLCTCIYINTWLSSPSVYRRHGCKYQF